MTFEYIVNSDLDVKKLNKEEEENLVKKISSKFTEWNSERSKHLEMAQNLSNEIFFKNEYIPSGDKTQRWKSKIKMCKTFMFYQTLKSYIWRNTYANVNSMFDVSGENHDSNNNSNKQKAMLVDIMEKMDYQKTCDQIIDNALLYGELMDVNASLTLVGGTRIEDLSQAYGSPNNGDIFLWSSTEWSASKAMYIKILDGMLRDFDKSPASPYNNKYCRVRSVINF